MRKISLLNRISLDGFFDDPNGSLDWAIPDTEVDKAVHQMGEGPNADTMLLGRVTYQHFEAFWPTVTEDSDFPPEMKAMAREVNGMPKWVFSNTLKEVPWQNSKLFKGDLISEVKRIKAGEGGSLLMFGSGTLVHPLTEAGLIDDYVFILTPVVLGQGKPQFKQAHKLNLELVESRAFQSGNVVLHYKPKK